MKRKHLIFLGIFLIALDIGIISRFVPLAVYQFVLILGIVMIVLGAVNFQNMHMPRILLQPRPVRQPQPTPMDIFQSLPRYNIQLSDRTVKRNFYKDIPAIITTNITKRTDEYSVSNFIAIDVETTGLKPATNRIISISAIRFEDWEPMEIFYTLINPQTHIPEEATQINNITDEMVANAPTFSQVADSLMEFVGNSNLVGHKIQFDLAFLYCSGLNLLNKHLKFFDTLELSQYLIKKLRRENNLLGYVDDYKLPTLCRHFRIPIRSFHNAGYDSYAAGLLFEEIVSHKL